MSKMFATALATALLAGSIASAEERVFLESAQAAPSAGKAGLLYREGNQVKPCNSTRCEMLFPKVPK